jgi:ribosomal protein S24E
MEIVVVDEKENPFFKRKEVVLVLKHDASSTPSKAELVKQLAATNGVDESQVVIDYIFTKKGISESMAKVKILKEKPPVKEEPKKQEGQASETQAGQSA